MAGVKRERQEEGAGARSPAQLAPLQPGQIELEVNGAGGSVVFRIWRTKPLNRVFQAYAGMRRLDLAAQRFQRGGQRLDGKLSAEHYGLEDRDVIFVEQLGD